MSSAPYPALSREAIRKPLDFVHEVDADTFMDAAGISIDPDVHNAGTYFLQHTRTSLINNYGKTAADVANGVAVAIDLLSDRDFVESLTQQYKCLATGHKANEAQPSTSVAASQRRTFSRYCLEKAGLASAVVTELTLSAIGISNGHPSSVIGATAMAAFVGTTTYFACGNKI